MSYNFAKRAELEEAMDAIESYPEYRRCLHDLDSVSRLVLAHRPTLRFLDGIARGAPLRILDVACGDGSMLRRVAGWAKRRNQQVHLMGLDLNPRAIQAAREFPQTSPAIEYLVADVLAYDPTTPPDVILSAHFTHHLTNPELVRFLQWMERTAVAGWFVNDLHRHPSAFRLFRLLTSFAPWHPIVKSDGLLSIRRAFTLGEWSELLLAARIPEAVAAETFPARITVTRLKPSRA